MRSTKKQVQALVTVAAAAFGCDVSEVFQRVDRIRAAILESLQTYGFSAIHLSPYRNNRWELSALCPVLSTDVPGSARWIGRELNICEFIKDPAVQLDGFLCELAGEGN